MTGPVLPEYERAQRPSSDRKTIWPTNRTVMYMTKIWMLPWPVHWPMTCAGIKLLAILN